MPRQACFLAQQAAEKAIKAVLVLRGIEFPKTHSLPVLAALVPSDWPEVVERGGLEELTVWAVESRYPGELFEAGEDDALAAAASARGVLEAAEREFPLDKAAE